MDMDQSLIDDFVAEAKEHLETAEDDLMAIENSGGGVPDPDIVNRVFRAVHTVKGAAGFLGLDNMQAVAHAAETILSLVRTGEMNISSAVIDPLLQSIDMIGTMLDDAANSNDIDASQIIASLEGVINKDVSEETQKEIESVTHLVDTEGGLSGFDISLYELKNIISHDDRIYSITINMSELLERDERKPAAIITQFLELGDIIKTRVKNPPDDLRQGLPTSQLIHKTLYSTKLDFDALVRVMNLPEESIVQLDTKMETSDNSAPPATAATSTVEPLAAPDLVAEPTSTTAATAPTVKKGKGGWDGVDRRNDKKKKKGAPPGTERRKDTIRLKLGVLDELMRLAGELVLVRNQQILSIDKSDPVARANAQRLDIVTSELQETIMATRMQPIGNLFNKFPRIVRELGKSLDKRINLEINGSEVELDNTILEALSDPLTHLIRNSCDHGVELPAIREAAGKSGDGRISLSAYHESGQINIEISDDGKGIDPDMIRRKVLEKEMKTESELDAMGEKELVRLILLPGFSTAEVLSDVSGRGVGMDVVKTKVEQLGGTLDIESSVGRGSTIFMRLPLTLAIIPSLMVMVGDYRYAIPQVNLEELVCLYDKDVMTKVECAGSREVYRLRDHLLTLVRLDETLARTEPFTEETQLEITELNRERQVAFYSNADGETHKTTQSLNFAVLKVGVNRFGLIVDQVLGTEEIVVKPMHPAIKKLKCYAGATVMGDGKVALILDVPGVARHAGVDFTKAKELAEDFSGTATNETQTALLFKSGASEQFGISLPLIRRIETVDMTKVQRVGDREYVTLDDTSTLILRLDAHLKVTPCEDKPEMSLILPKFSKTPFGILASELVDSIETSVDLNTESYMEDGLLGTSVVKEKMTLFIDIHSLIRKAQPDWFHDERHAREARGDGARILLVEDTAFYRQLVRSYLQSEGFVVVTANDGKEGLDMFDQQEFDMVVSDIEMPVMDGFEFIINLRKHARGATIPAIALSALDSKIGKPKALKSGFDRFEAKLDRDNLLTIILETLADRTAGAS